MDELIPLIFVVVVIISITSSSKRKKTAAPQHKAPLPIQPSTLDEDEGDFAAAIQQVMQLPRPIAKPVSTPKAAVKPQARQAAKPAPPRQEPLSPALPRNLDYQPLQARVVELQQEPRYVGSMGDTGSTEGMDPDHDHSLHLELEEGGSREGALPAIATLFQRDELVKGIVLSEVLARPTTCKWGSR